MEETFNIGDLRVGRLGFGAMRITGRGIWGEPADVPAARALLRRAVELGVTFIDTADSYGPAVSERLIAEALRPYPSGVVIASKGGYLRPGPGSWQPDGRPEHLREACEGSLRRLGVDRIDLYQLHVVDPNVPLEESVGTLAELQREGKIAHVGLSNVSATQVRQARKVVRVVSVQNRYNLVARRSEDLLHFCEREGIAFVCWSPVDTGLLGGSGALGRIARAYGASPAQIALAWLLHRSPVTIPIPGTSSTFHLKENMAASRVLLTEEDVETLDRYRVPGRDRLRRNARRALRRAAIKLAARGRSHSG
jgi:aryl-alcohol dehydrogenase-like predicted oxidoreductase